MLNKVETLLRERIAKFTDVGTFFEENEYLFKEPLVDQKMLVWKTDTIENAKMHLGKVKEILEKVDAWTIDGIKAVLMPYAEAQGKGNVLWPLRVALSGKEKSPDPFELATLLGKEATLKRITVVL
jgi:glutamyl/glutaminyl-tRNA synthetase